MNATATETATAPPEQLGLELPDAMTRRVTVLRATRQALLAESEDYLGRVHAHFETFHGKPAGDPLASLASAAYDAYEGLACAGTLAYLIAAMLREADEKDHALAQELAEMVDLARDSGLDWLGDANDDLAEQGAEEAATGRDGAA